MPKVLYVVVFILMTTKKCAGCKKTFSLDKFKSTNAKGEFHRKMCTSCRNIGQNKNKSRSPETYLKSIFTHLQYSRKKKNPDMLWALEAQDLIDIWHKQKGMCALTGLVMTYHKDGAGKKDLNASIDRIDPHTYYIPSNIQLVCSRVNILKHTLSEDLLYWWCKNIVEFKEKD